MLLASLALYTALSAVPLFAIAVVSMKFCLIISWLPATSKLKFSNYSSVSP